MTDPRIAVLSALSSPGWHPVPEAHGMPWDEAVALLDAYDASRAAAPAAAPSAAADRAALRDRIAAVLRRHASLGGTPPRYELPFFDGSTPSLPRISGWQPLDDVADAVLAVLPAPADDAAGVAEAIRSFPFDNFGMDDISFALEDDPEAQEWVPALADAVLAVLPAPADRAAIYREVADRLAADAEQGEKEGLTRIYRRSAARQVREWADQAQQPETRKACGCGQDGCEYCDVDDDADEEQPESGACTCAAAGDCFAPAGHYADCPQAEQSAAVSQPGKEATQ